MFGRLKILLSFIFITVLAACSGSGGSSTGSAVSTPSVTVSSKANQTITGFPHAIDYYIPSNAEYAVIFLHGGGGQKESFAYNLGIKNNSGSSDYEISDAGKTWLTDNKVLAVFPQGQHVTGMPAATTWNNYVMDSGKDDVAFLQNLVAALRADSSLPAVTKFYLVGHSNGGMMVNRMWCESPSTFAAYGALAGPPSSLLASTGAHPCHPAVFKPYIGVVGNTDTQLQTTGQMGATTWTLSSYNGGSPAWVSSTVLNDLIYFSSRTSAQCSGSPSGPSVSGQLSTYTGCSGTLKEIIVTQTTINGNPSGGDHCIAISSGSGCVTTLAGATGLDYKTTLFEFLKNF